MAVSPDTGATETTTAPSPAQREKTAATLLKAKSPQSTRSLDPVLKNLHCIAKCAVELTLLLAAVVALTVWLRHNAAAPVTASPCSTVGCRAQSSEFNGTLNYSVDPCVDMDAFVCSMWRSRGSGEDRSSLSLLAHVIREYEASVAEIFLTGRTEFAASRMATDFLRKCTQRQAAPSLDNFKHFFALSSLPWPFDVTESVDTGLRPLERVLNLSLMWDIDTWFRAYINSAPAYESNTTGVLTLFVETSAEPSVWLDFVRSLEMTQSRMHYYRRMHDAYNGTLPDSAEVVRRLAAEKKILSVLDTVRASRTGAKSVVTSLRKILAAVPHTELSDWLEPIRAASGSKAAHVNALVSVQDVRLLRAVDELLSSHSSGHLLEHLSWWLLQRLTVIGWPQAYDVIAGSETAAKHAVKLDCYELAATRFALLFASESAVQLFSVETRHRAEAFLRELISDMADIAGKAAWLSDKAKAAVRKTLLEIEVVLWPPDLAASNATLWKLYSNLGVPREPANNMVAGGSGSPPSLLSPTEPLTLFDQWRHASDVFRRLPAAKRERMQLLWQNDDLSPFFFDRWNRRLRVSQAALLSPLYQPKSAEVRAADYGGLGAAFLLHVLRAFEQPAAGVDDGMLPRLDYVAVAQKARDLKCGARFLANLREVAALGIAWYAMKKRDAATTGRHSPVVAATTTDERGRVHTYTSDQLFFLAHCRSRCRGHLPRESLRGKDCNVAVRHVRGFAKAFGCVRGSPMAPANECVASDFL